MAFLENLQEMTSQQTSKIENWMKGMLALTAVGTVVSIIALFKK